MKISIIILLISQCRHKVGTNLTYSKKMVCSVSFSMVDLCVMSSDGSSVGIRLSRQGGFVFSILSFLFSFSIQLSLSGILLGDLSLLFFILCLSLFDSGSVMGRTSNGHGILSMGINCGGFSLFCFGSLETGFRVFK